MILVIIFLNKLDHPPLNKDKRKKNALIERNMYTEFKQIKRSRWNKYHVSENSKLKEKKRGRKILVTINQSE